MGRIFETRKHTMFARWNKMSKAFTRISKDIVMAVKAGGASPDSNHALRRAVQNARALNMPKDKIEAAIKRGLGKDTADYAELVYEGYAPHGIAVLVVTATDNPTRTIANIRVHFNKGGGAIGQSGSVAFAFNHMGVIRLDPTGIDADELELELIDHGLEEAGEGVGENGEKQLILRSNLQQFSDLLHAVEQKGITPLSSQREYIPLNLVELPAEHAEEVLKLVDRLEQDDDVQHVFHNLG